MTVARRAFGVIGDPVGHTLSPRIFSWLFARLGRADLYYSAFRVPEAALPGAVDRVRRGVLGGLSVTLPHKEAIVPLLDAVDPEAARFGAVNCVGRDPSGRVTGFNTDALGFAKAVARSGLRLSGARIVLLGAGGAGRAAAFAAIAGGAVALTVANRTESRAERLASDLGRGAGGGLADVSVVGLDAGSLRRPLAGADLLVNATSVGLSDPAADPLPAPCRLDERTVVLDMVYRPLRTALLRRAGEAGCGTVDGLWMLVYQALEQLRLWTGDAVPDETAVALHAWLVGQSV